MESNAPSMSDVAKLAGVSKATVSRIINHKPGYSKATEIEVLRAMKLLDYHPNKFARALKTNSMKSVAVSIPYSWHPFFGEFIYYVELALNQNGYSMFLSNNESDPKSEISFLSMAKENKVDGIIAITYNDIEPYLSTNIPFVSIDRFFDTNKYTRATLVTSDNFQGGQMALKELKKRGAHKVAFFGDMPKFQNSIVLRKKGFIEAAKKFGVDYKIFDEPNIVKNTENKDKIIEELTKFDGIFAINDETAYYLVSQLEKYGLIIPEDIQIIGFDGFNILRGIPSPISSIAQSAQSLAKSAVDAVISIINGADNVNSVILPVSFRVGRTTREK